MHHMNAHAQFDRVADIAAHVAAEAGEGQPTPAEIVSATTAYLIACDRTGRFHHLEDAPGGVFDPSDLTDAQEHAWAALWEIIGEPNTTTNGPRYTAAWDVWGIVGNNDEAPGMDANEAPTY